MQLVVTKRNKDHYSVLIKGDVKEIQKKVRREALMAYLGFNL